METPAKHPAPVIITCLFIQLNPGLPPNLRGSKGRQTSSGITAALHDGASPRGLVPRDAQSAPGPTAEGEGDVRASPYLGASVPSGPGLCSCRWVSAPLLCASSPVTHDPRVQQSPKGRLCPQLLSQIHSPAQREEASICCHLPRVSYCPGQVAHTVLTADFQVYCCCVILHTGKLSSSLRTARRRGCRVSLQPQGARF